MATYLNLKVKWEEGTRTIPATEVKKAPGRLIVFNGEKQVSEFSDDIVEYWSLDETRGAGA